MNWIIILMNNLKNEVQDYVISRARVNIMRYISLQIFKNVQRGFMRPELSFEQTRHHIWSQLRDYVEDKWLRGRRYV